MVDESDRTAVAEVMRQINQAWLEDRIEDLKTLVHPEIIMVTPDFSERIEGRESFVAGFHDFFQNATIHEYQESDHQFDLIGETAIINFTYEMLYDFSGVRYRATGRDLWVFQKPEAVWRAVWRTMLDVDEQAV